jgi:telomeric repeat-binding factor 2-interacting protein 1
VDSHLKDKKRKLVSDGAFELPQAGEADQLEKQRRRVTEGSLVNDTESGDNSLLELPFQLSPPPPPQEGDENEKDCGQHVDNWISSCLKAGRATTEQHAIDALKCTTMDPDLAETVLAYLVAGKGIPIDMRGVWTAKDDEYMEGSDARDIQRMITKHGSELYNARWEYLEMQRSLDLEADDDGAEAQEVLPFFY